MIVTNRLVTAACRKHWLTGLMLVSGLVLSGCATSKNEMWEMDGAPTMQELWQSSAGNDDLTQRGLLDRRSELRRGLEHEAIAEQREGYTRDAANEIYSQFSRLPNPDLVMYVFPHLAGEDPVPIPGYSTVFPLYSRPQFAMPGETSRPHLPGTPYPENATR